MGSEQQPRSIVPERNPNVKQTETFNILLPNKTKIAIPGFMQAQILNLLIEKDRGNKSLESRDLLDLFDAGIPYPKRRQRVRMSITNLRKKLAEHDLTIYAMEQNGSLASYRLGKKGLTKLEVKSLFSQNGALEPKPQENQKPELEPAVAPTVDFSAKSPEIEKPDGNKSIPSTQLSGLEEKATENSPFVLPDGKKTPKSRGKQREFLRLLIAAKNEGRDFSEQDLRIMYPDIDTPLYAWKKLSKTAVFVRPRIRDLGWNIEFKISKDGTKKTYELNQSVEPSGSNSIPIIFPDGTEGPRTWGRIRKILETLIEAHKKGVIFSKREIWQKVCPEIPFEKASYKISKAIGDNLKSILLNTQWQIETVQASQNEPVTYALTKKDETNENPISEGEIPVSANGSKPIEDSAPAQEPVAAPTVPEEETHVVSQVDVLQGQIELAKPVESSRSNPIPVILPDGNKGSRTWGRTRKILETLIEAHKEGRIFSKKEIWQKACPEITFEEAGPIISGAAANLRYDMARVGWIIETVQTPKGEPVTYALRKKGAHRLEYTPGSIQRAAAEEKPLPHPLPAVDTNGSKHADLPPYEPIRALKPEQKPITNNGLPPTADIFRKISSSDRHNGKREATVLFEGEKEEKIIDSIKEVSRIILSQTLAGKLEKIKGATPRSLMESALPIGTSFDMLFKIDSQEEFNQRFIEAIMSQWRRLLSDNHTLLSIKEIEDRQRLLKLKSMGYTRQKMEIFIRALFKIPFPNTTQTQTASAAAS